MIPRGRPGHAKLRRTVSSRAGGVGRVPIRIGSIALVAGLSLGSVLGTVMAGASLGEISAVTGPPGTYPVALVEFDDARRVVGVPQFLKMGPLQQGRSGTVTSTRCIEGGSLGSGEIALVVDDMPVLALATSTPIWRTMTMGLTGPDVDALRAELLRLGYSLTEGGAYDQSVVAALGQLGLTIDSDGGLDPSSVLFLPAASVTLSACEMPLGAQVDPGTFAAPSDALMGVRLEVPADASSDDPRVLTLGGVVLDFDPAKVEDSIVSDPASLSLITGTSEWSAMVASDGQVGLLFGYALAIPKELLSVPPGAIAGAGGKTCVFVGGEAIAVDVVASSLGRAIIDAREVGLPAYVEAPGGRPC